MVGLANRAGAILPGTERVREAARSGTLQYAFVASDVSDNSRDKLVPLLEARRIPYAALFDRAALGAAVGKAPLSALGITETKFASRVKEMVQELREE